MKNKTQKPQQNFKENNCFSPCLGINISAHKITLLEVILLQLIKEKNI